MLLRRNLTLAFFLVFIIFALIAAAEDTDVVGEDATNVTEARNKEAAEEIEKQVVNVEAEDPDLVGSVFDIDFQHPGPHEPLMSAEDSQSFFFSILMIIFSEIGDKTFFIAAIMAMRNSRLVVFSAAFASLVVMSILSAALGHTVPNIIPRKYTAYLASLLFMFFGARMAYESWHMSSDEAKQEFEEVQAELKEKEDIEMMEAVESGLVNDKGESGGFKQGLSNLCQFLFSPTFTQTFILTFLGEWGDRSQIATIALAASKDVYFVTLGTITGHSLCTGLAVVGGGLLAERISVRTITLSGAVLFIIFGVLYLYEAVYDV
ncbi:2242_t:CDS:2 [Paraglomus brasilianum]|uniref:GDT1 family protein n=1 Tax=Paraglomus brasilianum TaxID=144538 RepID=A0A9N8VV46_9GLOM|nr:2242_t:CDS:2 [Paraglomus brasilianum]